jgi:hypothetical protein
VDPQGTVIYYHSESGFLFFYTIKSKIKFNILSFLLISFLFDNIFFLMAKKAQAGFGSVIKDYESADPDP